MKKIIKASILGLFLGLPQNSKAQAAQPITIEWTYPTAELNGTTFYLYSTNNVNAAISTWPLVSSIANTNKITINVNPGIAFYTIQASNFWGVANFSAVVSTPAAPRADQSLILRKGLQ